MVRMSLAGASPQGEVSGLDQLPGRSNYFIGNDPAKWRRNVAQFARVRYSNVYPGIDLVYHGNQGQLEYDFEVAPGADPKLVALSFEGPDRLDLDSNGDIVLGTKDGSIRLGAPRVHQKIGGEQRQVPGRFVMLSHNKIGFDIGAYDHNRELIIDPVLSYSTFLGGGGTEGCVNFSGGLVRNCPSIAVDTGNNFYVTGMTTSTDFPTTSGVLQPTSAAGAHVFVTKFNPSGAAPLVFSTYLGGSGTDASAGIAVDPGFNVYVAGTTNSRDFPTMNGFQATPNAPLNNHVFVSQLKPDGSALLYSTYLSGSGIDIATGLAVDVRANVYVTGTTTSTDFPVTPNPGAFQTTSLANNQFFFSKINTVASGTASLVYSTYVEPTTPSTGVALGGGIAVDSNFKVYITGGTDFTNMPVLNANQGRLAGGMDAFVAKFDPAAPTGSQELYFTYLGGIGDDIGNGIAVDSAGNAYVTGSTTSDITPPTSAFQSARAGGTDAFVAKFGNPASGSTTFPLNYFSYLGGSGTDVGLAIAVDPGQNAHVTGSTDSPDFNKVNFIQGTFGGGLTDAFVALIPTAGSTSTAGGYSTYLGGSGADRGTGIAVDANGATYVAGETASTDFLTKSPPQTPPFQPALNGGANNIASDASVAKLGSLSDVEISVAATPTVGGTPTVGVGNQATFTYTITNNGPDTASAVTFTDTLPATNATFNSVVASTGASCTSPTGTPASITCAIGTINVGATATVTVFLTPTLAVTLANSGIVTANGSSTQKSASAFFTVTDFSVCAAPCQSTPPSVTVTAGAPATYTVTVTPLPTYNANVSLSCSSGLPAAATCQFTTNPVTIPNTSAVSSTLVINTTARPVTTAQQPPFTRPLFATWLTVSGLALLGLGIGGGASRKRRMLRRMLFGGLLALTLLLPACGSRSKAAPTTAGTPAGTYTVTVSGTSGSASRTTTVTLVVQ